MTIALGILASDGVVIAADTQESYGVGGAKVSSYKISSRVLRAQASSFAATGAGWAGHLDNLNQELADNFEFIEDRSRLESRFREKVRKFYQANILPTFVLPPDDRPSAAVIVGVTERDGSSRLWATELGALYRCKSFDAVGVGAGHAKMLLGRVLPIKSKLSVRSAALFAAYTIFHVKKHVEGCGIGTHITVLQNGDGAYVDTEQIARYEAKFETYMEFDARIVNHVLGQQLMDNADDFRLDLRIMRLESEALELTPLAGEAVRA